VFEIKEGMYGIDAAKSEAVNRYLDSFWGVHGYMDILSARFFLHICLNQAALGRRGNVCEIGCLNGRSFPASLLSTSGDETGLAIDTWEAVRTDDVVSRKALKETFVANVRKACPREKIVVRSGDSTLLDPETMTGLAGGRFRFVYVDGSHKEKDVLVDLRNSTECLTDHGIIACDDAFQCAVAGVAAAVQVHLHKCMQEREPPLVPFAVTHSQLLCCRPAAYRENHDLMLRILSSPYPHLKWEETEIHGTPIVAAWRV